MDDRTLYYEKERTARKEYICNDCLYPIKKGEKYLYTKSFSLPYKTTNIFYSHLNHYYCICGEESPTRKCAKCECEEGIDYVFQPIKIGVYNNGEPMPEMLSVHIPISEKARKNDSRADIMYPPETIQQAEREYKEAHLMRTVAKEQEAKCE